MKAKQFRIILGFLVLFFSFQNCNSPQALDQSNSSSSKDSKTGSSTLGSGGSGSKNNSNTGVNSGSARNVSGGGTTGSGGTSGGGSFGGISGGGSGSGSSSGGSSSGPGGICIGCGSGTGGGTNPGGGSTGPGGIGGGETTFKITTQPIAKTIAEGTEFFVGISFQGGRSPYTFKWFRNGEEIPPVYGDVHYETYSNVLDRIYKEGEYHVTVKDASGATLTSNKVQIRMIAKTCQAGKYFIDLTKRTNTNDPWWYFNDLFYYKTKKYLVSQYNPTVSMMQLPAMANNIGVIGFSYFNLGGNVNNNQNFSIECSTDVPTIHTSECATNALEKCYYNPDGGYGATKTYEGEINFTCRNGYLEFVSNTCHLVDPPPPPNNPGDGG